MLKHEMRKLFIKQYGLIMIVILVIAEFIMLRFTYTEQNFDNETLKNNYYEYMSVLSGKVDAEKESFIFEEQEKILDAQNEQSDLVGQIINGELTDEELYIQKMTQLQPMIDKATAFDIVIEKFNYAAEKPQSRYMISGDFDGLKRDYPDVIFTAFIIVITAMLFMSEETSGMISFIRISGVSGCKTLGAKVTSLTIIITLSQILVTLCEFFYLCKEDGIAALSFPLESIEFFVGCPYNISIGKAFLLMQLFRLVGYFFLSALVAMLSVTVKKSLFVVFIPCALCLIQQFMFSQSSTALYLPTGLLRASGYFRGDVYEERSIGFDGNDNFKVFSEVPLWVLLSVIIITVLLCLVSYFCALKRYERKTT